MDFPSDGSVDPLPVAPLWSSGLKEVPPLHFFHPCFSFGSNILMKLRGFAPFTRSFIHGRTGERLFFFFTPAVFFFFSRVSKVPLFFRVRTRWLVFRRLWSVRYFYFPLLLVVLFLLLRRFFFFSLFFHDPQKLKPVSFPHGSRPLSALTFSPKPACNEFPFFFPAYVRSLSRLSIFRCFRLFLEPRGHVVAFPPKS